LRPGAVPVGWPPYLSQFNPDATIHFAATRLTIRDFIAAVEAQSKLRLSKGCCGNGWTVLWGEYCGLSFYGPDD
jgi:hypothetical protein